jgi:cysteine desulfurase/selenocysteine lyase
MAEHHSNLLLDELREKVSVSLRPARAGTSIHCRPEAISSKTRLVAVTHMPNILGTVQPVETIGRITRDAGVPLVVDGAQSVGHFPVDVTYIDYLAIPGHKGLLGPQGTGALYVEDPDSLRCSIFGGGMVEHVSHREVKLLPPPAKFEPGTPNIPGVIGLGPAIDLVSSLGVKEIHAHEKELGSRMFRGLSDIPGVTVYSPDGTGVVSFSVAGENPNVFARKLDDYRKICVRSGMHCAEHLASSFHCEGTIRASVGCYSTADEVDALVESVRYLTGHE